MLIDWAVAERPITGERVSGDRHVVEPYDGGVLVAVIDALGHGEQAAKTAQLAADALRGHAHEPLAALIGLCHQRLRAVRGAVMSLASFDARHATLCWAGVGNVEAVLVRSNASARPQREALLLRNGVVGFQVPEVRETTLPVSRDDVLIVVTDGVAGAFLDAYHRGAPQQLADDILAQHGKLSDDALVLVARYLGTESG
jgi:negative regulator of sigma-B (phosphoserine phosphatase)